MNRRLILFCCFVAIAAPALVTAQKPAKEKEIVRWVRERSWAKGLTMRLHASVNADSFYVAYHRNPALWDAAFAFLKNTNLDTLRPGKYPIAGEAVFASVTEAPLHDRDSVKWESHKNYIDLQSVIRGKEGMGIADTARATITKPYTTDAINYTAEGKYYVAEPGEIFLFFPNDAHRPTLKVPGYDTEKKIVIKIQTAQAN